MQAYAKAVVAFVVAVIGVYVAEKGIDLDTGNLAVVVEALIVALLTAAGVYVVPNRPQPARAPND